MFSPPPPVLLPSLITGASDDDPSRSFGRYRLLSRKKWGIATWAPRLNPFHDQNQVLT